ncbi:E3 ubiquitin-protein ligase TRIM69-like isoform X3 [Crassostrea virginica]
MHRFSHSRSGQGNTYNLHVGNTFNFYFGQTSSPSNTARAISRIPNSHLDPGSYTSERSNSRTRRESEVAASQNDDLKCKVCMDKTADFVILMCGHYVCDSCGQRLKSNDSLCHICRQPIQDIIKTYRS